MTVQYISLDRVSLALPNSYNGSDDASLGDVLTSSCAFLDTYCGRANGGFAVQTYDELYNGTGERLLFLNNTPIQSISRIATTETPALSIHNTDSDMGCRALVQIIGVPQNAVNLSSQYTSTGITLTYVKNAVTFTNTLLWSDYPTINALVAAINGLGHNWTAQVMTGLGGWSSSDLRATQGNFNARIMTAYFWVHWQDLSWYRINENIGEVFSQQGFARGSYNWRVVYTAGYSTFPDDLAQALAELTAATYLAKSVNPNMASQSLGGYSYSQAQKVAFEGLSVMAKKTIGYYKTRSCPKFSTW